MHIQACTAGKTVSWTRLLKGLMRACLHFLYAPPGTLGWQLRLSACHSPTAADAGQALQVCRTFLASCTPRSGACFARTHGMPWPRRARGTEACG